MATYDVGGRAAIVTGGGSGIGRAIAWRLAGNGASVLVADLALSAAEEVTAEISSAGGTARAYEVDVSQFDAVSGMVAAAKELGPLRIAVNNAGISGQAAPIAEVDLDDWRRVIEINLNSVFYCMKAQIPAMIAAGGGAIINMASVLGSVGIENSAAYVTAKHGLLGLTQNAALEYAREGIRAVAVGPAFIGTPLLESTLSPDARRQLAAQHALGRLGTTDEVATMVCFLASDDAAFITGSYHLVDGGYAAH